MLSRVWSFLLAVVVIVIVISIALEAIRLYLPVIGFALILIAIYYIVRFLIRRRGRL